MAYKTVLVHLDDSHGATARLQLAAGIAVHHGGHLVGAALTGVSRLLYRDPAPDADPHLALHLGYLRQRAAASLAGAEAVVTALGLTSFEQRVVDDEAGGGISLLARYADLVVIGQFDPDQAAPSVMPDFPAHVVLNAARPVLVVPRGATAPAPLARPGTFGSVLVAWNGSTEAARAVNAALPLLKQAEQVIVAVVDGAEQETSPGAALQVYLARHGVKSTLQLRSTARHGPFKRHGDAGAALLGLAGEVAADLLVMGAYGHSRLRETLIGGVTRSVLQHMHLTVLMSH